MLEEAKNIAEREPCDSKRWKRGNNAKFLQINSIWGVKFYKTPETREYSWNLQNIAATKASLGPPVGDWIDSDVGYGYLTMIADIEKHKSPEDIKGLYKKLEKIGFHLDFNDNSAMDNVGYFENELVAVDFEAMWLFEIVPTPTGFGRLRLYPQTTPAIGETFNWRYTLDKE